MLTAVGWPSIALGGPTRKASSAIILNAFMADMPSLVVRQHVGGSFLHPRRRKCPYVPAVEEHFQHFNAGALRDTARAQRPSWNKAASLC